MTLDQQIAAAARELALRKAVYPGFVRSGKMKAEKADHEILAMQAILDTLQALRSSKTARIEDEDVIIFRYKPGS